MGRLDPEKRMEVLLEAFVHLAKRNARAHLVFAGDGSTRPALEVQAETTEFRSRIHFLGMVPRSDLPNLLHDADLFITASTSEVHPISMIEAIASGLPVVAVKDDAYDGLLEDGVNGRATARDAQSIGDAVLDLLNHPETLAQYRQASAELSRKFSIEAQVNSLIRLYRTTIEAVKNNS
jgi:glycosyltransferase involved in cell wall biosynthesis